MWFDLQGCLDQFLTSIALFSLFTRWESRKHPHSSCRLTNSQEYEVVHKSFSKGGLRVCERGLPWSWALGVLARAGPWRFSEVLKCEKRLEDLELGLVKVPFGKEGRSWAPKFELRLGRRIGAGFALSCRSGPLGSVAHCTVSSLRQEAKVRLGVLGWFRAGLI
ncbi:unnamed protein product [Prunus armeniaca]